MRTGTVLALWAADEVDAATAAEFARIATAAAAAGLSVALLDLREERARSGTSPDEAQRLLEALASAGAPLERASPGDLRAALLAARSLLRLASLRRSAQPALLEVSDAWIRAASEAELLRGVREAGQVVRA